ncbi:MAG TPA: hypothetical protein PLD54_02975 [Candidatus Levybacteria bacterium]|nr:hypothetical protein [Candidatus Levybacteria bacterium]
MSYQEMNYEFEQNMLMEERLKPYDILKGLESSGIYGHARFSEFYDAFSTGVIHKTSEVLCIVGEPVSGKSSVASNIIALLQEEDVTIEYLPWFDCLRAAKYEGIIAPEKPFSEITPEEFHETSSFLSQSIEKVVSAHQQDRYTKYATIVDIVAMTAANTSHDIDRGTSAVAYSVAEHEGNVLLTAGDPDMRALGKQLRRDIHAVTTLEELYALLDRFSIAKPRSKKGAMTLWEELKTGAPPEVVERNEQELNSVLFDVYVNGGFQLPVVIDSPKAFENDPIFREMTITQRYMPFLAEKVFGVQEERAFIGTNKDIHATLKDKKGKIKRPALTEINYFRNTYPLSTP